MNAAEFDSQFNRLTQHFHLPADASRESMGVDWFKAVEHYHVDALERAVTEMIRTAQDRFWPPLGKLLSAIQSRFDRYDRTHGPCHTCHGNTWIEAQAYKANGQVYTALRRCPDCGVPAPSVDEKRAVHPLTDLERHEYQAGRYLRSQMPAGLEAKHPEHSGNPEIRAMFEQLRIKLFGQSRESA